MPWPEKGLRRASVNSFGLGGSNAHVVLDDALHFLREHNLSGNHNTVNEPWSALEATNGLHLPEPKLRIPKLLTFSGRDKAAMKRLAAAYKEYFERLTLSEEQFVPYMRDLAFTLNMRRTAFLAKGFSVADSLMDLQDMDSIAATVRTEVRNPVIAFVFTGQGAVWAGMGSELLAYPVFKERIIDLESYLKKLGCAWSLLGMYRCQNFIGFFKLTWFRRHYQPKSAM